MCSAAAFISLVLTVFLCFGSFYFYGCYRENIELKDDNRELRRRINELMREQLIKNGRDRN